MGRMARGGAGRGRDGSRRQERAHDILDAAGALVLRLGYDKTTVDDVARRAGVAKGTIYLHWNTREALFGALLRRERMAMFDEIGQQVTDDPHPVRGMVRALALGLLRRPLLRAAVLGDSEVLGKLVRQKRSNPPVAALRPMLEAYLEPLRQHGAVRADLTVAEYVTVLTATLHGFFLAAPLLPEEFRLPDEQVVELLADTASRALDSGRPLTPEGAAAVSRATCDYLEAARALAREKFQHSMGMDTAATSAEERAG